MLAADYPFQDVFWTMMIFFGWIIWLAVLFMVLADNFRLVGPRGLGEGGMDRLRDLRARGRGPLRTSSPGRTCSPATPHRGQPRSRAR